MNEVNDWVLYFNHDCKYLWYYILGFAIGYGSHRSNTDSNNDGIIASALQLQQPNYIFLNNNTGSCPALIGDRLLTTMKEGDSFEGKVWKFEKKNYFYFIFSHPYHIII